MIATRVVIIGVVLIRVIITIMSIIITTVVIIVSIIIAISRSANIGVVVVLIGSFNFGGGGVMVGLTIMIQNGDVCVLRPNSARDGVHVPYLGYGEDRFMRCSERGTGRVETA